MKTLTLKQRGILLALLGVALLLVFALPFAVVAAWSGADAHRWAVTAGLSAIPGVICVVLGCLIVDSAPNE